MTYYRIFVSDAGKFRDPSKYEFIAEFVDRDITSSYVRYMGGKKRYRGKDIIIKTVDIDGSNPADGRIEGIISALGEVLNIEEYGL